MTCAPCTFAMPLLLGFMVATQAGPGWGVIAALGLLAAQSGLTKLIGRVACPASTRRRSHAAAHPTLAQPIREVGIRVPRK